MRIIFLFTMFLMISSITFCQDSQMGINLTGMERTWQEPRFRSKSIIAQLKKIQHLGFTKVRIPLSVDYLLTADPDFLPELGKVLRYADSHQLTVILAYFDHQLSEERLESGLQKLKTNWQIVLKSLEGNTNRLYLELANEPQLSPDTWYRSVPDLVGSIRQVNPDIPIILGATNFNSLFELSRMHPWALDRVVYTFHYYEPYLFTHQGTVWTGPQNSTLDIPYPYDESRMPALSPQAHGTAGEVNYRDYELTGNRAAMEDKIGQIARWAADHGVELWCTEYGVTANSDSESRKRYLLDLHQVLQNHRIPGYIWEWEGNFGVKNLIPINR